MEKATCLLSPCCLFKAPLACPVPLRWALRHHLYLCELALHLRPLDLPGGLVIGVGLLQLAAPRPLLPQLHLKLLQQRPQGLQHVTVLPKLHQRQFRQKHPSGTRSEPLNPLMGVHGIVRSHLETK